MVRKSNAKSYFRLAANLGQQPSVASSFTVASVRGEKVRAIALDVRGDVRCYMPLLFGPLLLLHTRANHWKRLMLPQNIMPP